MTEGILERIKSRGYWFVTIRPLKFEETRIPSLTECERLVRECIVSLRGWDYPHISRREGVTSGPDWIQAATDWQMYKELWRIYQSGQFVHFFGCREDWWCDSSLTSEKTRSVKPGTVLEVLMTLFSATEIYEFASRLAQRELFDEMLQLTIELHGMENRRLTILEPGRTLFDDYICAVNALSLPKVMSTEEILGKGHDLAMEHTIWILERFNWRSLHIREILKEDQTKFLERRF